MCISASPSVFKLVQPAGSLITLGFGCLVTYMTSKTLKHVHTCLNALMDKVKSVVLMMMQETTACTPNRNLIIG
jgi:hypothetical protein